MYIIFPGGSLNRPHIVCRFIYSLCTLFNSDNQKLCCLTYARVSFANPHPGNHLKQAGVIEVEYRSNSHGFSYLCQGRRSKKDIFGFANPREYFYCNYPLSLSPLLMLGSGKAKKIFFAEEKIRMIFFFIISTHRESLINKLFSWGSFNRKPHRVNLGYWLMYS